MQEHGLAGSRHPAGQPFAERETGDFLKGLRKSSAMDGQHQGFGRLIQQEDLSRLSAGDLQDFFQRAGENLVKFE